MLSISTKHNINNKTINKKTFFFFFADNNISIYFGDSDGSIIVTDTNLDNKWKKEMASLNLNTDSQTINNSENPSINRLISVTMQDEMGITSKNVFACSVKRGIEIYNENCKVFSFLSSSFDSVKVNSICTYRSSIDNKENDELLVACEDGSIFQISKYKATKYSQVGYPLTTISTFKVKQMKERLILVGGHFDCLKFYCEQKFLCDLKTSDWVQSIGVGDMDGDGEDELVLGLLDNNINIYKLQFQN